MTTIDTQVDRRELLRQIGTGNVLAISGGRVNAVEGGVELPVSNGYIVRVTLTLDDTYTVERILRRSGKEFPHGKHTAVYCDQVGEIAYRASCFRSYNDDEWVIA